MRKISWILILLIMVSFSGRLVINNHAADDCVKKTVQKKNVSKQEQDALGTMMLLPISFNMEVTNTSN